jgi:PII-like signaling protein
MRGIEGEQVLVRIYLGESKTGHHKPLYQQVIELLRTEGLAGTTVLKGARASGTTASCTPRTSNASLRISPS